MKCAGEKEGLTTTAYIGSALLVRRLRRLILPANGPRAVSRGVVGAHLPSATNLGEREREKRVRSQVTTPFDSNGHRKKKKENKGSLAVIQVALENHETRRGQVIE